jgi:hypothetical protein
MCAQVVQNSDVNTKLTSRPLDERSAGIRAITPTQEPAQLRMILISRTADLVHEIHTQTKANVERTKVSACNEAIRSIAEHTEDAVEVRDPVHEDNVCIDSGTDKNENVTQHNEGDNKGTVQGDKGADGKEIVPKNKGTGNKEIATKVETSYDKPTVPGGKSGDDKDDETDKM